MSERDKPLVWLHGEVKTPPFSRRSRLQAGWLLRHLQAGQSLQLPHCRSRPTIAPRCSELRIPDDRGTWRIIFRIDSDAVLILDVFQKKSQRTPRPVITRCRRRLSAYERDFES